DRRGLWSVVAGRLPADVGTIAAFRILAHDHVLCLEPGRSACPGVRIPRLAVPALQYSGWIDDADAAGRRLLLRLQICLRLHPLLAALLASAVLRPLPCIRTPARRPRRVSSAEGRQDRLRQTRRRLARRPYPDESRTAPYQRRAGATRT